VTAIALADKVVAVHRAFTRAKLPHAFGGALALAYYATPRATIDIDVNVFVRTEHYSSVAAVLRKLHVDTIPEAALAVRDGQVRAWWAQTPIDLFFSYDPVHDAMRTWVRTVPFGTISIPILAAEHLMVAKAVFDRAKDWLDIEQMLVALDDLDAGEVRRWLNHLVGDADPRSRRFETLLVELRGKQ
jgi:hypothetical protein